MIKNFKLFELMQNFYYFCTEILASIDAQGWGWEVKEYDICRGNHSVSQK
jgi:hypothetical protein